MILRRANLLFVAVIVVSVLLLSGCGSSDSPSTSFDQGSGPPGANRGTGPLGGPNPAALRKLASCMKSQGVRLPANPARGGPPPSGSVPQSGQPPGGAPFGGSAQARKALQACRQYLPQPPG